MTLQDDYPPLRHEVLMFAYALEKQMRYNESRGKTDKWKSDDQEFLYKRMMDEIKELHDEICVGKPDQLKIRHESLDVGSMSCFIWYNSLIRSAEETAPQDGGNR